MDNSTQSLRAISYRLFRYLADRLIWGVMVSSGIEWIIVRTFTRDTKAQQEKEQALRLLRAVICLPPPTPDFLRYRSQSGHDRRNAGRKMADTAPVDPIDRLLGRIVPLTDGMVRALVSVAENPEDPIRMVCMETLIELGERLVFC